MTSYVAFIGDSFCADYEVGGDAPSDQIDSEFLSNPLNHQGFTDRGPCWTTELARLLQRKILPFGFGGMNWWHSRYYFMHRYEQLGDLQKDVDILVFCHTSHNRPPKRGCQGLNQINVGTKEKEGWLFYYDNIYDEEFAHWARARYFAEISELFSDKITVHLSCFDTAPHQVLNWNLLPGIRFCEPLIWLQVAEHVGSMQDIQKKMYQSPNCNHVNSHNNIELANQIFSAIQQNVVGDVHLDFSKFDVRNPNFANWPNGDWSC